MHAEGQCSHNQATIEANHYNFSDIYVSNAYSCITVYYRTGMCAQEAVPFTVCRTGMCAQEAVPFTVCRTGMCAQEAVPSLCIGQACVHRRLCLHCV